MKINKNIRTVILIATIALSITGCSNDESGRNDDDTSTNIEQTKSDDESSKE